MELRESAEIIRAGIAWAGWNDKQNEAMKVALKTMQLFEKQQKEIERLKAAGEKLQIIADRWVAIETNGTPEDADDFYSFVQDTLSPNETQGV